MKQAFIYSLKVWLTTAVLGMRVAALIKMGMDTDHLVYSATDIFSSALYDIPIGLIACMPSGILFSIIVRVLNRPLVSQLYQKLWLSLIAIPFSIMPFAFLFWHQLTPITYLPDMLPELISYTGITIAGIWFYNLKAVTDIITNERTYN